MEMFFPYLFFVALIGFWASKWNRSVMVLVLVAFIFSPVVAGIILLFMGNNNPQCPACKGYVDPTATKCRHCGNTLSYGLPREIE
tara:strand:+ start:1466 stop:1720 length:255 start_codon:yes stop_codon:yes gene_type:complete